MAGPMTADRSPLYAKEERRPIEAVIFRDPTIYKKGIRPGGKPEQVSKEIHERTASKPPRAISLKKAKYDVRKFGISGFDKQRKEEARIQLAIELGARPNKRTNKNYKELLAELKTQKAAETEQRQKELQMGIKLPKSLKQKSKKGGGRIRALKCQVGRYENGFQMIPKRLLSSKQRLQLKSTSDSPTD